MSEQLGNGSGRNPQNGEAVIPSLVGMTLARYGFAIQMLNAKFLKW